MKEYMKLSWVETTTKKSAETVKRKKCKKTKKEKKYYLG